MPVAGVHGAQIQPIRIWMPPRFQHASNDDVLERCADVDDLIDRRAEHRKSISDALRRRIQTRYEITQPTVADVHTAPVYCSRKRISVSYSRRMSGMP